MKYEFAKLDGAGNDFVLVEDMDNKVAFTPEQVSAICHRRFGIGADGLIVVKPSEREECVAYMDYYNSDGTKAQMCGNGVRCFTKFVVDRGIADPNAGVLVADTLSGPKAIEYTLGADGKLSSARVDMGEPILTPKDVPTTLPVTSSEYGAAVDVEVQAAGYKLAFTAVSMGNPHAIAFVDDVFGFPVDEAGPAFECADVFPEKANIEFAHVKDGDIDMRVWERGCGETYACGTGSCACAVAAVISGRAGRRREFDLHLLGGVLHISWATDNHVYMQGPAHENYSGTFDADAILR